MTLRPSVLSVLAWAALPLAFCGVGLWMVVEGALYGWLFVVFFGAFAALLLTGLGDRLVLDDTGFRLEGIGLRGGLHQRWEQLGPFGVEREDVWAQVAWHNEVSGASGTLPHNYGMAASELSALMEGYRTGEAPTQEAAIVSREPLSPLDRERLREEHARLGRTMAFGTMAGLFVVGLTLVVDEDVVPTWVGLGIGAVVAAAGVRIAVQRVRDERCGHKEVIVGPVQQRHRATTQSQVICSLVVGGVQVSVGEPLWALVRIGDRLRIERSVHTRRVLDVALVSER